MLPSFATSVLCTTFQEIQQSAQNIASFGDSMVQVLAAREHQAEFWAELALKSPSLARLDSIGQSIARAMNGAEESFKRLLRLNPNSVPVMRRYSQFLAEVQLRSCTQLSSIGANGRRRKPSGSESKAILGLRTREVFLYELVATWMVHAFLW
jgi:hypothetical protein